MLKQFVYEWYSINDMHVNAADVDNEDVNGK